MGKGARTTIRILPVNGVLWKEGEVFQLEKFGLWGGMHVVLGVGWAQP